MRFIIDPLILKNAEKIAFLEVFEDAKLPVKGYEVPKKGLNLPLRQVDLLKMVQKENVEEISLDAVAEAMALMLGIDSNFKDANEYKKFLEAYKGNLEGYIGILVAKALKQNDIQEAVIFAKSLIFLEEKNDKALYNYGMLCQERAKSYIENNRFQEAKTYLDEARDKFKSLLERDNNHGLCHYHLGFYAMNDGEYKEAKRFWEKALSLDIPEDIEKEIKRNMKLIEDRISYQEALEALEDGAVQEALDILLELKEKKAELKDLELNLGYAFRRLGYYEDALETFEEIYDEEKENPRLLSEMALSYAFLGNLDQSLELYLAALEKDEENMEIMCNIGMVYLNLGEIEEARAYIEKALDIDPRDEIARACLKELNTYEEQLEEE